MFELINQNLNTANFYAFGIGKGVNHFLMEGIARVGKGESFIVKQQNEADEKVENFIKYVSMPVMTDIKVEYAGFDAYDVEPASIPDLLADRPIIIYGKWKGEPYGKMVIRGVSGKNIILISPA